MHRRFMLIAGLLAAAPTTAATLTATSANLSAVFNTAKAGDTIRLTGSFGRTGFQNRSFATTVTIDARAATFTDTLSFSGVDNIKLLGGKYGNANAAAGVGVRISGSNRVTVSKPIVVGNGTSSHGIDVSASTNITISGGSFTGLRLGVGFVGVTGGTITGNKSLRASNDGFNVADSHNILVSHNSCTDGAPGPGVHPDCVQLWSIAGHTPQSDIEISDNTATGPTQGFTSFNGDDGGGDRLKFLRNRVDTSFPQGIACYNCRDSIFTGNVLTTQAGAQWRTSLNVVGGSGNTISGNSVGAKPADMHAATLRFEGVDTPRFDRVDTALKGIDQRPAILVAVGAVPEPASWAMLLTGFAVIGAAARRRRRAPA